jgi:hypothetical protein
MSSNNQKKPVNVFKTLSDFRQSQLVGQVETGSYKGKQLDEFSPAGNVVSSVGIKKQAQAVSLGTSSGSSWRGSGDSFMQTPEVYSPLWLNSNLNLPRDYATTNAWCRSFYALNPIVQNAINLHSTYPISKLVIKCPNKKVENFFQEMIEEIDLLNICIQVAQEYWLLGEAFIYAELDSTNAKWSRLIIQNPDYIVMRKTVIADEPIIMMRPDENIRRIVFSNKPNDIEQRRQLNDNIVAHVKRGENIPLDNMYISHIARRISPYQIRGTGLPVCIFRQLALFDLLRESKFAQAHNMINPLTLVKIGNENYKATPADLEIWRDRFSEAQYDKDFKIFTHDGVSVERIGYNSGILDISGDVTQLQKEMYIGLMIPQVLMDGGSDVTYANGGVTLDVLRQRYMSFRHKMSYWLRTKIFEPIAKMNEFYNYSEGKKTLIIPDVDWNHMSLFDAGDYVQTLSQLATGEKKHVSMQTLYRSLGLEYEEERRKIKKEDISEAIRQKEISSLSRMSLNELRALSDDDEIPEIKESPLPGESPYDGPSGDAGGPPPSGGGLGLGPSPDSGPPPGLLEGLTK